jgi:hypothetical protein
LNCDHFGVNLDDRADQPIPNALAIFILVVAEHLDIVPNLICLPLIRSAGEI